MCIVKRRQQQLVLKQMSGGRTRRWARRSRRRVMRLRQRLAAAGSSSVKIKVRKLQRTVPGGIGLEPDLLFLHTAHYILRLRFQVHVLQALSNSYIPS